MNTFKTVLIAGAAFFAVPAMANTPCMLEGSSKPVTAADLGISQTTSPYIIADRLVQHPSYTKVMEVCSVEQVVRSLSAINNWSDAHAKIAPDYRFSVPALIISAPAAPVPAASSPEVRHEIVPVPATPSAVIHKVTTPVVTAPADVSELKSEMAQRRAAEASLRSEIQGLRSKSTLSAAQLKRLSDLEAMRSENAATFQTLKGRLTAIESVNGAQGQHLQAHDQHFKKHGREISALKAGVAQASAEAKEAKTVAEEAKAASGLGWYEYMLWAALLFGVGALATAWLRNSKPKKDEIDNAVQDALKRDALNHTTLRADIDDFKKQMEGIPQTISDALNPFQGQMTELRKQVDDIPAEFARVVAYVKSDYETINTRLESIEAKYEHHVSKISAEKQRTLLPADMKEKSVGETFDYYVRVDGNVVAFEGTIVQQTPSKDVFIKIPELDKPVISRSLFKAIADHIEHGGALPNVLVLQNGTK